MPNRNSLYKLFAIFSFWLPTSNTFALSCLEFINSKPTSTYQIKSSDDRYKLMWIGDDYTVLKDPKREYLKNREEWVDCIYDERAYVVNGNLSCGEKLLVMSKGKINYIFDKKGVRWFTRIARTIDTNTKDCRIFEGERTLINGSSIVSLFIIPFNNDVYKYFLIEKTTIQKVSVYYPEF